MSPTFVYAFVTAAIVGLFGILANAVIVYSVFYFKSLQTVSNMFLVNWSVADCLSILSVPFLTAMYAILYPQEHHAYSCLSIHTIIILHVTGLWFNILLSVDCITATYYVRLSEKLRKSYWAVIAFIWIAALPCYCLSASLCVSDVYYYFSVVLFFIFYVVSQLFAIVPEIHRIINKCKTSPPTYSSSIQTRLTVIAAISSSYLIGVMFSVLTYFGVLHSIYNDVLICICIFISVFPVLCRSVMALGLLCFLDKDFRSCLHSILIKAVNIKIPRIKVPNYTSYCIIPTADKSLLE
ncbi:hypothetical protein ILUMI_19588 [Ignelater luminosus]|uniref:G-protein coupled receptors family 1 profile domain-containing protein n=1 Tax=Ignelater luminosus TaxID=2038154 RepID=A0A8K0CFX2_IGNLU|nr:hypothetical protein ILUMI_19588 [Ignelater luminosus]